MTVRARTAGLLVGGMLLMGPPDLPVLRQLTDSRANDYCPTWSPDGTKILFSSWRGGTQDLWVIPSQGGEPRRIDSGPGADQDAAWSPDGDKIAYLSQDLATGNQEIFSYGTDGAILPLVTHPAEDYHPSWSGDGRWLAFTSNRLGTPDVWILDLIAGDSARVLLGGPDAQSYASWSPDGRHVLFQLGRTGYSGIYVAPFDKGVCGTPVAVTAGKGAYAQPRWSRRGDRIAFVRVEGSRRTLFVARAGSEAISPPVAVPLPDSLSVYFPDWSPDGHSIAFSARSGGRSGIWIVSDPLGVPYQEREEPSKK